ncbi:MAG TPA: phosphate/phosphite/phosphonate ABC transporter substrate-binding protein [Methylomirabilota bacterium]|jgi:phosphonate transport system substrate-binding protein|nr:phosphate/phosphite/phosphonate ABC transporter substrate-binding protein [Methylomirabilota bacterium]
MTLTTVLRALASVAAVAGAVAVWPPPLPGAQTASGASVRQAKLVIAVQPTSTPELLTTDAKELREFLSKSLNRDVEIVFPMTYAGVVEALRFGHAQAAFMSAWPAQLAVKHAKADVALAEVREVVIGQEKKTETFYFSYWVVAKDSPVETLEQLRGKRAAFPSPLSTSGYVAPLARLVELGLVPRLPGKEADPKGFFGDVRFAGGYAQGWEALKAKQVDVTVIAGDVSEKLYREVLAATKIVEQQGPIPSHAVLFAGDLDPAAKMQLRDALLDLGKPEHRGLMRKFVSGIFVGFKPTTAKQHLGALDKFLSQTQLAFVERLL